MSSTNTDTSNALPKEVRARISHDLRAPALQGVRTLQRRGRDIARNTLGVARLNRQLAAEADGIAAKVQSRREGADLPAEVGLGERLKAHLLETFVAEIERRGGETEIQEERGSVSLTVLDRRDGYVLLGADGWRHYSRSFGSRRASLRYLCGKDDNGPWAVRVAGSIDSVWRAVGWLEPAAVAKARETGRRVLRQGDVYLVERLRGGDDFSELPESHHWNPVTRYLVHRPDDGRKHRPLRVPFQARVYVQQAYEMGRSGRKNGAD